MRKGPKGSEVLTVLTNSGAQGSYTVSLDAGYGSGTEMVDLYSCNTATVSSDGTVSVKISGGMPQALVPASAMGNSGLCGNSSK